MHILEELGYHTADVLRQNEVCWPTGRTVPIGTATYSWNIHNLLELTVKDGGHKLMLEFDPEFPNFTEAISGTIIDRNTSETVAEVCDLDRVDALAEYMFSILQDDPDFTMPYEDPHIDLDVEVVEVV